MHVTARTYLTSGVAALGAGAIALAPVQPIPNHLAAAQQRAVSDMSVSLAASIDPITPWVDTFKTSLANIQTLGELNKQNPFPLLKTFRDNLATYAEEAAAGNANLIPGQIKNNITTFFQAPWSPGEQVPLPTPPDYVKTVSLPFGEYVSDTHDGGRLGSPKSLNFIVLQILAGLSLEPDLWPAVGNSPLIPVFNFLNTHYSGKLLGWLGPVVSPVVQLTKSFTAVGDYFKAGDVAAAVNELINIPAHVTNAFLNGGGYLNLGPILSKFVSPDIPVPLDNIGFNFGGLLNVVPQNGSLATVNPADPPTKWSGGVGMDALAGEISQGSVVFEIPGIPVGLLGANIGLRQFLADKLVVKPVVKAAAVAPAAATPAAAPDPVEAAPVEAAPIATPVEAPAPQAVSVHRVARAAAATSAGSGSGSDNNGGSGHGRTHGR